MNKESNLSEDRGTAGWAKPVKPEAATREPTEPGTRQGKVKWRKNSAYLGDRMKRTRISGSVRGGG